MDIVASEIVEIQVDITGGEAVTYETRNCSAGADPVLHLFKPGATSDIRTDIAFDDNSAGGVNARISLTPTSGGIGFLTPVAKNDAVGTCDIWRNGYPWRYAIGVGGKTVKVVGAGVNDAIETVSTTFGGETQAIYVLNGTSISQKARSGSGTGNSARFVTTTSDVSFLVHGSGPTRIVVNDVNIDADGDGLGDRLESELGTCSSLSAIIGTFHCSWIKTPMDTDADGLSDAWELLGKRDVSPHQLLPRWGANPRHKDAFVEVDFLDDGVSPPGRLDAYSARLAASYWGDTLQTLSPAVQAQHAAILSNPDGLPGVALHFDAGRTPDIGSPTSDFTLFGNWGGYDVAPLGTDYKVAWRDHMIPARRGAFHWMLGARSGGGQTAGFPSTASIESGQTIAHELGHTVGLSHAGNDATAGALNCKPQYASPMNYTYSYAGVGFTDGVAPGRLNNTSLLEFASLETAPNRAYYADLYERVFGYYVDHTTWSVDYDRDGEIAPSGMRVRAAANSRAGGECEGVRERRTPILTGTQTTHGPAVVRTGGKIVVLTPTDAGLQLHMGSDTYFGCATPGGGDGSNPCGTFATPTLLVSGQVVAVDAVTVKLNGGGELVVFAYVDAAGALRSGHIDFGGSGNPIGVVDPTLRSSSIVGEPAMALQAPNLALAVFKTSAGVLKEARYVADVGWVATRDAQGTAQQQIVVTDAPGIVVGRMPGDTVDSVYLHARHDLFGYAYPSFAKLNDQGYWVPTTFVTGSSSTRPGLAYVPNAADPNKGKMYAVYAQDGTKVFHMRTSGVIVRTSGTTVTKTPTFGFDAYFDNEWTHGYGLDLMFEPGKDSNLRAAVSYDFGDWKNHPVFQPLADGIVDLSYGSFNDWGQIAKGACSSIANPGGLVANPMSCL